MAKFELKLPKMGESVAEATINSWLKEIGDNVEVDESVIEISTDKVDSDVPSEVSGVLIEKKFDVDSIVEVGQTFAVIETDSNSEINSEVEDENQPINEDQFTPPSQEPDNFLKQAISITTPVSLYEGDNQKRFYSPLVKNIAKKEGVKIEELNNIIGSGKEGRVTKRDILKHIDNRPKPVDLSISKDNFEFDSAPAKNLNLYNNSSEEVIEMSRMGKIISKHMVNSLQTSAHVQSFIEVDVTRIWEWREKIKAKFQENNGCARCLH